MCCVLRLSPRLHNIYTNIYCMNICSPNKGCLTIHSWLFCVFTNKCNRFLSITHKLCATFGWRFSKIRTMKKKWIVISPKISNGGVLLSARWRRHSENIALFFPGEFFMRIGKGGHFLHQPQNGTFVTGLCVVGCIDSYKKEDENMTRMTWGSRW